MNKRTLGVNYTAFRVTSKGDLFDMLCNLAYVKNKNRSTALSRLIRKSRNMQSPQSSSAI